MIFSYNCKFEALPAAVNKKIENCKELSTVVPIINCKKCVVYSIPLPCGNKYVGQTGQCINTRLTKHKSDVSKNKTLEFKRLADHTVDCEICNEQGPDFINTNILFKHRNRKSREIIETFFINNSNVAISTPQFDLHRIEVDILNKFLRSD